MGKELELAFLQRHRNGQKAYKKMPNTICFRDMQIKTTVRYYITAGMVAIKKKKGKGRGRKKGEVMKRMCREWNMLEGMEYGTAST